VAKVAGKKQPQSGERMQPTAQAVGEIEETEQAPKGRKNGFGFDLALGGAALPALRSKRKMIGFSH